MGGVFHFDEVLGFENFFEATTAEVGDREDTLLTEAGGAEKIFDILGVVVVKAVFGKMEIGNLTAPWVDFGTAAEEAANYSITR